MHLDEIEFCDHPALAQLHQFIVGVREFFRLHGALSFEAAVAGDGFLHLVPESLGVVLFVDVFEVPLRIHEPAAVDAEGVA